MAQHQRTVEIRQFITDMLPDHPRDISAVVQERFGVSRQAVSKHLLEMEQSGAVEPHGNTNAKTWMLKPRAVIEFCIPINDESEEHVPWSDIIRPAIEDAPPNVIQICSYGFTEMLNNVIDHSESEFVEIRCIYTAECITMSIHDRGVGIFRKISKELNLSDEREAILELAKGKVTTDPDHHTGEGVFFTSRMCDMFRMLSGNLFFTHIRPEDDWLIETESPDIEGTMVQMTVSLRSELEVKNLFDKYTSGEDDYSFSKTHVPVKLAQYGVDSLVSRSQARRVLSRFEKFNEVIIDFSGIEFIGQAFADEIFRVYRIEKPEVRIIAANTSQFVAGMIRRAREAGREMQLKLFPDE